MPKSLALQRAEQVALAVAAPMDVWLTLTRPLIFIMSASAGSVLKTFGLRKMRQGPVHSPDEVKLIVTASRELGQIAPTQEEMVHRALALASAPASNGSTARYFSRLCKTRLKESLKSSTAHSVC
jgi:CBS domain containing-hemolysin-like protein